MNQKLDLVLTEHVPEVLDLIISLRTHGDVLLSFPYLVVHLVLQRGILNKNEKMKK